MTQSVYGNPPMHFGTAQFAERQNHMQDRDLRSLNEKAVDVAYGELILQINKMERTKKSGFLPNMKAATRAIVRAYLREARKHEELAR